MPATVYYINLPGGRTGIGYARFVALANGKAERLLRLAIAMDRSDMDDLRTGFAGDMLPGLLLLGLCLSLALGCRSGWASSRSTSYKRRLMPCGAARKRAFPPTFRSKSPRWSTR